jgi:hypothetical protein
MDCDIGFTTTSCQANQTLFFQGFIRFFLSMDASGMVIQTRNANWPEPLNRMSNFGKTKYGQTDNEMIKISSRYRIWDGMLR